METALAFLDTLNRIDTALEAIVLVSLLRLAFDVLRWIIGEKQRQ